MTDKTYELTEIEIAVKEGENGAPDVRIKVPGFVLTPNFAATLPNPAAFPSFHNWGSEWKLTHIPTGRTVFFQTADQVEDVIRLAEKLEKVTDWNTVDINILANDKRLIQKVKDILFFE